MTNQHNTITYWIAYQLATGLSERLKVKLLVDTYEQSAGDCKALILMGIEGQLALDDKQEICIKSAYELLNEAAIMANKLNSLGIVTVPITDARFPVKLKRHFQTQRPLLFFAKGNLDLLDADSIAIVGSRNLSADGEAFAKKIAKEAVQNNMVVVSGNAKGADRVAMDTTLELGGRVIAVLSEGLIKNPTGYKEMYPHFTDGRLLYLSQFRADARWQVSNAMMRNKVIYGLSDAAYIADVELSGGTWEGAKEALNAKYDALIIRQGTNSEAIRRLVELGAAIGTGLVNNNFTLGSQISKTELLVEKKATTALDAKSAKAEPKIKKAPSKTRNKKTIDQDPYVEMQVINILVEGISEVPLLANQVETIQSDPDLKPKKAASVTKPKGNKKTESSEIQTHAAVSQTSKVNISLDQVKDILSETNPPDLQPEIKKEKQKSKGTGKKKVVASDAPTLPFGPYPEPNPLT